MSINIEELIKEMQELQRILDYNISLFNKNSERIKEIGYKELKEVEEKKEEEEMDKEEEEEEVNQAEVEEGK